MPDNVHRAVIHSLHAKAEFRIVARCAILSVAVVSTALPANANITSNSPDRQAIITLLEKAYGTAIQATPSTSLEIRWIASYRQDFSKLETEPPKSRADSNAELPRERGTTWLRLSGDWRRNYSPTERALGPSELLTHVSICALDFWADSPTKHSDIVTLQYQTDDKVGKRGLSATTVACPGFIARIIHAELVKGGGFHFQRLPGVIAVRSDLPEDLDADLDEKSGLLLRLTTRMSPNVILRAIYRGYIDQPLYPGGQPAEMSLELENQSEGSLVASRFQFSYAAFADVPADLFHWSDIAPRARWAGSELVRRKDGSLDETATARVASHNVSASKPATPQTQYDTNGQQTLIDHATRWRSGVLLLGISFFAGAAVIAWRRR